jgi:hypothetical protein
VLHLSKKIIIYGMDSEGYRYPVDVNDGEIDITVSI